MSKVVNLNRTRKLRARDAKKQRADENAVSFGRTKAERDHLEDVADRIRTALDGHRREE